MGKREIIETLQMSVSIAKDAIEVLKKTNAIKSADNVKLKVENVGLSAQIHRQAELLESLQAKCDSLRDLHEQNKESLLSENSRLLHSIPHKKPRTYFEIASSEREFKVGEVAHFLSTDNGLLFNMSILSNDDANYPLQSHLMSFALNGKFEINSELRSLFTTAEMVEMGYKIPDVE